MSSDVFISTLQFFSCDVYYLLDMRSTISYMTCDMTIYFCFGLKSIIDPLFISTLAGDFVVSRMLYRGCVESIGDREMLVDLIEMDTVDFDIILEMDYPIYATVL